MAFCTRTTCYVGNYLFDNILSFSQYSYSSSLKVAVATKSPKSDKQYVWEGEANASTYTIREETDPEKLLPRGTRITLYLKVDC